MTWLQKRVAAVVRPYAAFCRRFPRSSRFLGFLHSRRGPAKALLLLAAHLFGFYFSIQAVMQTRTEQGAIAWAVSLNTMPILSVPAWLVFGNNKVETYQATRRVGIAEIRPLADRFLSDLGKWSEAPRGDDAVSSHRETLNRLGKIGSLPAIPGNRARLLIDGEATYQAILDGIREAKKYILFQFYIFRDDESGRRFRDALVAKAKSGVSVRILLDNYGSMSLGDEFIRSMTDVGIDLRYVMDVSGDSNRFQLNFRNHRKIVIIDGKTGYLGGLNIGDEYLGKDKKLTPWRDTHMEWRGPAVKCLQVPFAEDWKWATGEALKDLDWEIRPEDSVGEAKLLCLASGPADPFETCPMAFITLINASEKRIWIATPYFVPDDKTVTALQLAAIRGVDVRILIPDLNDSQLVYLSSFAYLAELEKTGVKVFRYGDGFLHEKVMLVDDELSVVGSANMDNRSFRLNFEVTGVVSDHSFNTKMTEMLEADFAKSRQTGADELEAKGFWFRLGVRSARLLAPLQ